MHISTERPGSTGESGGSKAWKGGQHVAGNSRTPGSSVISKVNAILLALAEGSQCTISEIAARTGLPLSTVHRLATELAAWRLLERAEDGRFWAGPQLRTIGATCMCAGGQADSPADSPVDSPVGTCGRDTAVPVMEDLFRVTGAPVRVGFLDGVSVAYIQKTSPHLPVSEVCSAARLPAHATALGKALLAFAPPPTTELVLSGGLRRYTARTVTCAERLRWGLRMIRMTRTALCDRELHPDWCGVAMPVFGARGEAVAAIELAVRDLASDVPTVKAALAMAAGALSRELPRRGGSATEQRAPLAFRHFGRKGGHAQLPPLVPGPRHKA
jgi:DNA-binding IclR family transcriptional regulator